MTEGFRRDWTVDILQAAPMIAPARAYVYPQNIPGEEDALARGALQLLVRPAVGGAFLATCALGFRSGSVPTGVWGCPRAGAMCAVAGGYAYVIETDRPELSVLVGMRPVLQVIEQADLNLLIFVGFHTVMGWGTNGVAWETGRLSWEGLRLGEVRNGQLNGWGWEMMSDREMEFSVDLRTGTHRGGGYHRPGAESKS